MFSVWDKFVSICWVSPAIIRNGIILNPFSSDRGVDWLNWIQFENYFPALSLLVNRPGHTALNCVAPLIPLQYKGFISKENWRIFVVVYSPHPWACGRSSWRWPRPGSSSPSTGCWRRWSWEGTSTERFCQSCQWFMSGSSGGDVIT